MRRVLFFIGIICSLAGPLRAQETSFTRQDTLRGSITPERDWWDLTYYHLDIGLDIAEQKLCGTNTIRYKVLRAHPTMQIDLQPPMFISEVRQDDKTLEFTRDGNAYFVQMTDNQTIGAIKELTVQYGGAPVVAENPPWDGGLTWAEDANGNPFVATSVQGAGASLWWPCKDHMYDEPDSMLISVNVPDSLTNISNGRLRRVEDKQDGTHTFHWFVGNPINNYGVNINVGDYVHFGETYEGEKGPLDCDYYVLRDDLAKAKKQFQQVPMMLAAFEHWFGPYPFYEDGFKLVQVPYLGMEHQSSVTYGNQYTNGYLGGDLSGTGWGLKFDFIIIHESGHEWFANNITYKDIADMWIHEGFTAYSENLYLDYHFGAEAAAAYVIGTRHNIQNDQPIIGPYGVNKEGSVDMYYKGANMLHTLRHWLDDDEKWRQILRSLNADFYHQTVTTQQIEAYLIEKSGLDLAPFFDQYLRDTRIPTLEWRTDKKCLKYRWANVVDGFAMPLLATVNGQEVRLEPTTDWSEKKFKKPVETVDFDKDFYIQHQTVDK